MNRFLQLLKWFLSPLETCVEHSQSRGVHQLADGVGICGDKILILAESSPSPSRGGELSSIHNSNQLLAENNILRKIKSNQAKKVNPSSRLSPPFRGGLGWGLLKEMTSPNPSNTSATLSTSIGRYYHGHNSNNGTSENNTPSKIKSNQAKKVNPSSRLSPPFRGGLGWGLFFILLLAIGNTATAQNFPVQVIPQALPPAPIYVSNYADASTVTSPLRVQIILNDFDIANREIRLKTYFTGSGLSFQSNDIVVGANPLFLEGGIPLVLTNAELAPYFEFTNITGINANQYGNAIPEGAYQFCVEVYDVLTGSRLSNKTCAVSVVFQNEPPFLVLPRNKINVDEVNPQYIVFQWTPRSINVSNVDYELSLVEIWDTQVDPQQAFLSSPPVFQTTTSATTYVYGPADPLLLSGKNYAWRVQAKAKQGIEEIGLFKNQGYSEIFSFSYAGSCDLPLVINHEVKGSTNANIFWDDFSTEIPEFTVRYRQKNVQDAEWFLAKSTFNDLTIWNLKAGTTYEYQLSKNCGITQSDWSFTKEFTTALEFEAESVLDCGVSPDINLTNMQPLASIGSGATFKAGDFPVKILEVSGANGRFTGKGYVTLPYLKNIKVAVEFTNILINTDTEMAEGSVRTAYDADWGNILDTGDVVDVLDDVQDVFTGGDFTEYEVDFEIDSVNDIKIEDGEIIITGPNGETKTFDHDDGDTYQIKDASGDTYNVDEDGNITKGAEAAEGGEATAQNTDGISGGSGTADAPSVNEITANGVTVTFKKSSNTKFDLDIADSDFERSKYPKAQSASGTDYYPVHKAVVDGQTDEFLAEISISNSNISIDDLIVKTVSGLKIDSRKEGSSNLIISLKGVNSYRSEEAIVTYKDEDGKYKIAASFFVHHIKQQELVSVVVVAVNGTAQLANLEQELNGIFGKAGGQFRVSTDTFSLLSADWDDNSNGKLDYDGSGLLSDYPQELKNIQQKYKQDNPSWDAKAYHLFLLPNDMSLTKPLSGFMPKTRQWGYIFNAHKDDALENKSSQNLVAAHELGHGVFKLAHPFQNDENKSGSGSNWLMDYNNGDQLPYAHWAAMSDESLQLFLFQDEEDSEYTFVDLDYVCVPAKYQNRNSTYRDLDGNSIILGDGFVPYAFVGTRTPTATGSISIIQEVSNGRLYYPLAGENKHFYWARDENGKLTQKFGSFTESGSQPKLIYVDSAKKVYIDGAATGEIYESARTCNGIPKKGNSLPSNCDQFVQYNEIAPEHVTEFAKKLDVALTTIKNHSGDKINLRGSTPHIIGAKFTDSQIQLLQDKFQLLSNETGKHIILHFQQIQNNQTYNEEQLRNLTKQVLEKSIEAKKLDVAYLLITYSNFESILGVVRSKTCYGFAYAQNSQIITANNSNSNDLFQTILDYYSSVIKPMYLTRYFESVTGEVVHLTYQSKIDVKGYPYINAVRYYKSKYAIEKEEHEKLLRTLLRIEDIDQNSPYVQVQIDKINATVKQGIIEEASAGVNVPNTTWVAQPAVVSQKIGQFREAYMRDRNLVDYFINEASKGWTYGAKFQIVSGSSELLQEHFCDFDNFSVIDPIAYGLFDAVGLIPGLDNFSDPVGLLYAGYRGSADNIMAYSISTAITGVGAFYFKAGSEVFGVVAKLNPSGKIEYFVRNVDAVDASELQLTTILSRRESIVKDAFNEVKSQQNDELLTRLLLKNSNSFDNLVSVLKNKGWQQVDIDLLAQTFRNNPGLNTLENAESWKILKESITDLSSTNALFKNAEAIEALTAVRGLPEAVKNNIGLTDEILGSLRGTTNLSYKQLLDKIHSLGTKLKISPATKFEDFYNKVLYKLNKSSSTTQSQKIGAEGVVKALDDEFDSLLKGKTVKFEEAVQNARGNTSFEDFTVEINGYDGSIISNRIEVKNCPSCIDSKTIKEQFIERDLFNATDIGQVKWKVYQQGISKEWFVNKLEENISVIEALENDKVLNFFKVNLEDGQKLTKDVLQDFADTNFSKIFI